ncbi:hypothetical protein ACQU0X_26130 [Pseudovibrio ascidiaceicola]|uniref:hypothetical protein n=1 Tax=Pseudovibrio ascidiaceicola TaxID=285279 RepID=UPI003D35B23A
MSREDTETNYVRGTAEAIELGLDQSGTKKWYLDTDKGWTEIGKNEGQLVLNRSHYKVGMRIELAEPFGDQDDTQRSSTSMEDIGPTTVIQAVCESCNDSGFTSRPRIVRQADFDLSGFIEQKSDFPGVEHEFVNRSEPGFSYDDYATILAVPIGKGQLFVIHCDT